MGGQKVSSRGFWYIGVRLSGPVEEEICELNFPLGKIKLLVKSGVIIKRHTTVCDKLLLSVRCP